MTSELVAQLIWNGLVNGALIALVALGVSLIYGVGTFIHFAHGDMAALGAYIFFVLHKWMGWPFSPAGVAAVLLGIFLGLMMEMLFFKRVRDHDPMIPLIISIGLSIGIQSLILLFWGAQVQTITEARFDSLSLPGGILATPAQVVG